MPIPRPPRASAPPLLAVAVAVTLAACRHPAAPAALTAGDSMLPTIPIGTPLTVTPTPSPSRGSPIVFRWQNDPARAYVKRVIGLPGEVVRTHGAEVSIDGVPLPQCRVGPWGYTDANGTQHHGDIWLEAAGASAWFVFRDAAPSAPVADGAWTVAPKEVFVLADNRDNTQDSRVWFGRRGGGLPVGWIVGAVPQPALPTLPPDAAARPGALEACAAELRR